MYYYRGMPIWGQSVYSSARDIGNMAAGYMTGSYLIPWGITRNAFDKYQSEANINGPSKEGISSTNAQKLGWKIGIAHRLLKIASWFL